MTKIYTVTNPKGGVGKTTSVVNLASVAAMLEKKVLVIDLDPNMSSTMILGVKNKLAFSEFAEKNVDQMFKENPKFPSEIAISLDEFGFDFIMGTYDLQDVDSFLTSRRDGGQSWVFDLFDDDAGLKKYDMIFIDTGGKIGRILSSLVLASDEILIPAQAAQMSIDQVDEILPFIPEINKQKQRFFHSSVKIAGVYLTMFRKNTKAAKENYEALKTKLEGTEIPLATVCIPQGTVVENADLARTPVVYFDPNSAVSDAFFDLYKEIILGETVEQKNHLEVEGL